MAYQAQKQSKPDHTALDVLQEFKRMFVNSRSLSVYLPEKCNGESTFAPGEFYRATTPYSYVQLKAPLTEKVRQEHNSIGAWINENFLIRLWAILESRGFTKPIRTNVRGTAEVQLLKDLRQHFAHGTGLYNDRKLEHRNLRRDLLKSFPVPGDIDGLPTNIDYVMVPMYERCLEYVQDVLAAEASEGDGSPAIMKAG